MTKTRWGIQSAAVLLMWTPWTRYFLPAYPDWWTDLVRLVTVSAAMVALSPLLSLVSALIVPPLLWVTNSFRRRIREAERRNRLAVGLMNTHLQETLGGLEVIRAFRREPAFVSRFRWILKRDAGCF